jgi:hypothetical protein
MVLALLAGVALTASTSCSEAIRTGDSPGYLVMNALQGAPGISGSFGSTLASDVISVNPTTGATSIVADRGQATLTMNMKDSTLSPSPANAITLTQYHVD